MLQENIVNVGVSVKRSRDVTFIDEKQSVDIKQNLHVTSVYNLSN